LAVQAPVEEEIWILAPLAKAPALSAHDVSLTPKPPSCALLETEHTLLLVLSRIQLDTYRLQWAQSLVKDQT
jgi:hypothetical protein